MFESSVPVFIQFLSALSGILKKAEAHCAERKIDPAVMLSLRLYPDMFPLTRQVQIAADAAKGAGARLAGVEIPSFPDDEKTFDELQARIKKTIDFLKSLDPKDFAHAEAREVTVKVRGQDLTFKGGDYLRTWALPNFFFHVTTAYNILRHNGLDIGKSDYLAR
jgi:hypothetical protein